MGEFTSAGLHAVTMLDAKRERSGENDAVYLLGYRRRDMQDQIPARSIAFQHANDDGNRCAWQFHEKFYSRKS